MLNLQSALTTDFNNHHNVLLCRLNVGYAARLNVASWISTTVICHFISMLLSSPFSAVTSSTVQAPPTGMGDVLQRIQSDSLGSCARKFLFTRLLVHAIKKWIRVKNESGFRQTRLRVHRALVRACPDRMGSTPAEGESNSEQAPSDNVPNNRECRS